MRHFPNRYRAVRVRHPAYPLTIFGCVRLRNAAEQVRSLVWTVVRVFFLYLILLSAVCISAQLNMPPPRSEIPVSDSLYHDLPLLRDLNHFPYLDWPTPDQGNDLLCDEWPHTELIDNCLSCLFGKQMEHGPILRNSSCPLSAVPAFSDDHLSTSHFEFKPEDTLVHLSMGRTHTVPIVLEGLSGPTHLCLPVTSFNPVLTATMRKTAELLKFILWQATLVAFDIYLQLALIVHEGLPRTTNRQQGWKATSLSGRKCSTNLRTREVQCTFASSLSTITIAFISVVMRYRHKAMSKHLRCLLMKFPSLKLRKGLKCVKRIHGRLVVSLTIQRSFVLCIRSRHSSSCLALQRHVAHLVKRLAQAVSVMPFVLVHALLLLAGDVEVNPGPTQAELVLDQYRDRFIAEMDANAIVMELLYRGIINDGVQEDISKTSSSKQRNEKLHYSLTNSCTDEALMEVCGIIINVGGNPKMSALGADMKNSLEAGLTGNGTLQECVSPPATAAPRVIGTKPSLLDLVRYVVPTVADQWPSMRDALKVEQSFVDQLNNVNYNEQKAENCALNLLVLWMDGSKGTGTQPRTWQSILEAVNTVFGPAKKEEIESKVQPASSQSGCSATSRNEVLERSFTLLRRFYTCMKIVEDEQFPDQSMAYINLALAPFSLDFPRAQEMFVKAVKEGVDNVYTYRADKLECENIPKLVSEHKVVVISGAPGVGKSTLARKVCADICQSPNFHGFSLVILIELRKLLHCKGDIKLTDVLQQVKGQIRSPSELAEAIENNLGRGVLFILDGFDELPPHLRQSDFLLSLLSYNLQYDAPLPFCKVVLTSRSIATSEIYRRMQEASTQGSFTNIEVLGFTQMQINEYARHYFTKHHQPELLKLFIKKIDSFPHIRGLCSTPVVLSIVCHVFLFIGDLPPTLTQIYNKYMCVKVLKYSEDIPKLDSILELPRDPAHDIYKLAEIAYHCILNQKVVFDSDDLKGLGEPFSNREKGCGLLTARPVKPDLNPKQGAVKSFFFIHLTVQEFLAAVHVVLQTAEEQCEIWARYLGEPHMAQVWRFYCGLTKLQHFNLLEHKIGAYSIDFQLQCLFETQEDSLVSRLMPHIVGREVQVNPKSAYESTAYGYCFSRQPALKLLIVDAQLGAGSTEVYRLLEPVYANGTLQTLHLQSVNNWKDVEIALDRMLSQVSRALPEDSPKDGALSGSFGKVHLERPPAHAAVKALCLQHVQEIECCCIQNCEDGLREELNKMQRILTGTRSVKKLVIGMEDGNVWTSVGVPILKGVARNNCITDFVLYSESNRVDAVQNLLSCLSPEERNRFSTSNYTDRFGISYPSICLSSSMWHWLQDHLSLRQWLDRTSSPASRPGHGSALYNSVVTLAVTLLICAIFMILTYFL